MIAASSFIRRCLTNHYDLFGLTRRLEVYLSYNASILLASYLRMTLADPRLPKGNLYFSRWLRLTLTRLR
jgi:hypothetical protein